MKWQVGDKVLILPHKNDNKGVKITKIREMTCLDSHHDFIECRLEGFGNKWFDEMDLEFYEKQLTL